MLRVKRRRQTQRHAMDDDIIAARTRVELLNSRLLRHLPRILLPDTKNLENLPGPIKYLNFDKRTMTTKDLFAGQYQHNRPDLFEHLDTTITRLYMSITICRTHQQNITVRTCFVKSFDFDSNTIPFCRTHTKNHVREAAFRHSSANTSFAGPYDTIQSPGNIYSSPDYHAAHATISI